MNIEYYTGGNDEPRFHAPITARAALSHWNNRSLWSLWTGRQTNSTIAESTFLLCESQLLTTNATKLNVSILFASRRGNSIDGITVSNHPDPSLLQFTLTKTFLWLGDALWCPHFGDWVQTERRENCVARAPWNWRGKCRSKKRTEIDWYMPSNTSSSFAESPH